MKLLFVAVAVIAFTGGAAATAATQRFRENVPLARSMLHQINTQEPGYAIREMNCRTLSPPPGANSGAIPTECLMIGKNPGNGLFCGVLYVDAIRPQQAIAFTIDHATAYPCALVARVLKGLKAKGFVVSALQA